MEKYIIAKKINFSFVLSKKIQKLILNIIHITKHVLYVIIIYVIIVEESYLLQ